MIAFVWQFEVKPESRDRFEQMYGANGDWTSVARKSRSYLGSSFLRDMNEQNRYLLTEYWSEMVVYERHLADFRDEIARLNALRAALLVSALPLGVFNCLDVPDRFGPTWSRRRAST